MYEFSPSDIPEQLETELTGVSGACYVALADYSALRWEIHGPYAASVTLPLELARHRSPQGAVYAAVLTYDEAAATVVQLTLSGQSGNQAPEAVLTPDVLSGETPLLVNFDASASSDPDGSIERYDYDLDASGGFEKQDSGAAVSRTYTQSGIYDVRLQVTDNGGASDIATVSISVNAPHNDLPLPVLESDVSSGAVPLSVSFDASGSSDPDGSIVSYDYDFDGDLNFDALDAGPNVSHNYVLPGSFNARLRVTDNEGAQQDAQLAISVTNQAPTAQLLPASVSGNAPLNVDFDASGSTPGVESGDSITLYEWDWDGDGTYDQSGTEPLLTHLYSDGFVGSAKLRVTDEYSATAIDTCAISLNDPPSAELALSSDSIAPGAQVTLDASASSDSDGSIEKYEWDSDGDGSFETDSGTDSSIEVSFAEGGSRSLKVRVTDDDGATATASALLFVQIWGAYLSPQGDDEAGDSCSMSVVNGKPAIAYSDTVSDGLRYVQALDVNGSSWGTPVVLDSAGGGVFYAGQRPSLTVVNSRPAVAYQHSSGSGVLLRYVRASDADGGSWETPVVITGSVSVQDACLAVINGRPAVSFKDTNSSHLFYVRAADADGDAWGSMLTADGSDTGVGSSSCLLEVNGRPAISYQRSQRLGFVRASDADGGSWPAGQFLDNTTTTAAFGTDMLVLAGKPVIAYERLTSIYYIRAQDAGGTAWDAPVLAVDRGSKLLMFPDMEIVDGRPAIAFQDNNSLFDLYYVLADDASGIQWPMPVLVDTGSDAAGFYPTLALVNGNPAIAHIGATSQYELRYVRASNSSGF